jgi:hypothetical protein
MRIVDVEPQLLKDFIDEMEVTASKQNPTMIVRVGRHPTLGKVVAIERLEEGGGFIVEADE